ncbi:MAG: hypothetical protein HQM08_20490 [Candidatus Riflebacteria bacterium]|nr:hypothetical protein [Candidatus Riflebacteria bacterium]
MREKTRDIRMIDERKKEIGLENSGRNVFIVGRNQKRKNQKSNETARNLEELASVSGIILIKGLKECFRKIKLCSK